MYNIDKRTMYIMIALIVVLSAVLSVIGGKLMDKYGKTNFYYPVAAIGVIGGLLLIYPGVVTDAIGLALAGFVVVIQIATKKKVSAV